MMVGEAALYIFDTEKLSTIGIKAPSPPPPKGLYDFSGGSVVEESSCYAEDPGSVYGSGRSPGEGNGNLLQYSCLGNPMDRGAWRATYSPWGCKESDMTELLNLHQPQRSVSENFVYS